MYDDVLLDFLLARREVVTNGCGIATFLFLFRFHFHFLASREEARRSLWCVGFLLQPRFWFSFPSSFLQPRILDPEFLNPDIYTIHCAIHYTCAIHDPCNFLTIHEFRDRDLPISVYAIQYWSVVKLYIIHILRFDGVSMLLVDSSVLGNASSLLSCSWRTR